MPLDVITAGGGLEEIIFWAIGCFILGVGAIESYWRTKHGTSGSDNTNSSNNSGRIRTDDLGRF